MKFQQPSTLSRVMHQLLDQLEQGAILTLQFADEAEAVHALMVLHEVARERALGVVVTPAGGNTIELRRASAAA
jgi:hypothetical protein